MTTLPPEVAALVKPGHDLVPLPPDGPFPNTQTWGCRNCSGAVGVEGGFVWGSATEASCDDLSAEVRSLISAPFGGEAA